MTTSDPRSTARHLARNVLMVSAAFALAAAAGLFRNMIIGRTFGIGAGLDAYYAAFKLPDLLFTIVAGGALATAFIPVFADFLAADERAGAWQLASAVTNWVVLVVGVLASLAAFRPGLCDGHRTRLILRSAGPPASYASSLPSTIIRRQLGAGSVLHGFQHFLFLRPPIIYPEYHSRRARLSPPGRRGPSAQSSGAAPPAHQGPRAALLRLGGAVLSGAGSVRRRLLMGAC